MKFKNNSSSDSSPPKNSTEENSQSPSQSPDDFLFGFANSIFQSSGGTGEKSNWAAAVHGDTVPSLTVGQFISHWDNFESDLNQMQGMGVNGYRFSMEWSDIEPERGKYDEKVLSRYDELIAACHARGIEPMITIYHFIEPDWFSKLKSFEKEENIQYYLEYCEMLFKRYGHLVRFWCTFNEPAMQAFSSYLFGQFPPHKHNVKQTILFLKNLLKAHVAAYKKLKKLPNGEHAQIGLAHHVLRFLPRYRWEPIENYLTKFLTKICNDLVLKFLKTGHFDYNNLLARVSYFEPDAPHSFDFIGLNFYGNPVVGFNFKNIFGITCFPHQEMSDFVFPIDSRGFSKAIDEVTLLKKPIYITEIGFAENNDKLRGKFFNEFFSVIKDKIHHHTDIRGCFVWTFADNYEWSYGYEVKFGLHNQFRVERESVNELKKFVQFIQNNQTIKD